MEVWFKRSGVWFAVAMVVAALAVIVTVALVTDDSDNDPSAQTTGATNQQAVGDSEPSSQLASTFDDVDFSASLVNFDKVLWGGVSKDGIPAISEPTFDPLGFVDTPDETLGILIEINDEKRYYPYNILVQHEIVNDSIGDTHFAVTYCPLCGSAIVFNAEVDGEVKEFGVSGFLFESNLIMYDRTDTPSLWSQARGEAIIGDQAGTELDLIDFQLLTLSEVRSAHADAVILSEDTGFARNYDRQLYIGYEDTDDTIFEISIDDNRFPAKEIFYIVPTDEQSVAIRVGNLEKGSSATDDETGLTIEKTSDGEVFVTTNSGQEVFGYYEMWFSWAQHHQDDGAVFEI